MIRKDYERLYVRAFIQNLIWLYTARMYSRDCFDFLTPNNGLFGETRFIHVDKIVLNSNFFIPRYQELRRRCPYLLDLLSFSSYELIFCYS